MERSDHPRVVVIGAGIVGSAIAMHLAERDLRPVLVAPDPAEQTTSARSFASISAFGTDPVGYYELACTALARWSKWAQRLGEVGFRRGGQLRWTADPQQGRRLALQVERARSRGYPIAPVDQAELRRLLPAAEPKPVTAGCHAPRDRQVEPELVVAACRAATQTTSERLLLGTRAGVRLAPVLGPLVAEEIATGEQGRLLAPFRPGRFAERATRVAHDVDELFR